MRFGGRSQVLAVSLFAMMALSAASEYAVLAFGEGIFHRRQAGTAVSTVDEVATPTGDSNQSAPTTTSSSDGEDGEDDAESTTAAPPTPIPTPEPSSSSSSDDSNTSTASTTEDLPAQQTSAPTPESTTNAPSSTTTAAASTVVTPLVSSSTQRYVTTILTVSGGRTLSIPVTSDAVTEITTGFATATSAPELNGDSNSSSSGGMSDSTKKIIGGVVGGVGGALLLGGIAVVAWRLRKKNQTKVEIDDDFLSGGSDKRGESQALNSTPFQSTLDQYHNPGTKPNAAANF